MEFISRFLIIISLLAANAWVWYQLGCIQYNWSNEFNEIHIQSRIEFFWMHARGC